MMIQTLVKLGNVTAIADNGAKGVKTQADFEKLTTATLAAARRLTEQLGGALPQDYPN